MRRAAPKRGMTKRSRTSDRAGNARRGALIIALTGDLGAGKTTFVQGFLKGLGAKGRAASPTFVIMRRHAIPGRKGGAYHIDAYRLKKPADLAALGFDGIAADPGNIILIEWAEKIRKILPRRAAWIRFRHGENPHERGISGGVLHS